MQSFLNDYIPGRKWRYMIDEGVRGRIEAVLDDIESSEDVRVVYACESGSRAWGFASQDSDYDVRFIYLHPATWYLAVDLEKKRDVIELPISEALDVGGWDLRKALQLLRKSNPPLLEWLGSPIIYRERFSTAAKLRELAATAHSPIGSAHHYLHMARGNFREYLKGAEVWRKKYFYVLRPILAIKWIEAGRGVPPTEFRALLDTLIPEGPLRDAIEALLVEKMQGAELDRGPRIDVISEFVESEIERLSSSSFQSPPSAPSITAFDHLFQEAIREVYQ